MQINNTPTSYGVITKAFHWGMAILIIGMLIAGLVMEDIEDLTLRLKIFGLHKSFGITILALVVLRILWHLYSKKPPLVAGMKKIEELVARGMHMFLYVAMIGMPLSGWLLSSAAGRPVSVFGLFTLPDFIKQDHDLKEFFGEAHEILGYTLIIALLAHAAAALKHHFVNKDKTLSRMLPF